LHDAILQFYLGIDPSQLDDEQWAKKIVFLDKIQKMEAGKKD
jgi:hypothetical protein